MKLFLTILFSILTVFSFSQEDQRKNYIGIMPSFLKEPYDTIDALEVNIVPLTFQRKFKETWDFELRSMVNYRIFERDNGVSQVGGTIMANKYFVGLFGEEAIVIPKIGIYNSTTTNLKDKIQTLTFGLEPGVNFRFSQLVSMTISAQPGINWYPNKYSQNFAGAKSGFLFHFGLMFQAGIHF